MREQVTGQGLPEPVKTHRQAPLMAVRRRMALPRQRSTETWRHQPLCSPHGQHHGGVVEHVRLVGTLQLISTDARHDCFAISVWQVLPRWRAS